MLSCYLQTGWHKRRAWEGGPSHACSVSHLQEKSTRARDGSATCWSLLTKIEARMPPCFNRGMKGLRPSCRVVPPVVYFVEQKFLIQRSHGLWMRQLVRLP